MTIRYQLASHTNQVWVLFIIMACIVTWSMTLYFYKLKPNIRELDMAVVMAILKNGQEYCRGIKSKNYIVRASGLDVQAGCARK